MRHLLFRNKVLSAALTGNLLVSYSPPLNAALDGEYKNESMFMISITGETNTCGSCRIKIQVKH